MLSKKTTFSLICLIIILTFAFMADDAMAQENNIGLSLDMTGDISHKDGFQMEHLGSLDVTIQFDKRVNLTPTDLLISIFDGNGDFLESPQSTSIRISRSPIDTKNWSVSTNLPSPARHIRLTVLPGIESFNPLEADRTEGGDYAIELLGSDPELRPDVYQIALVGFPVVTITTASFQVHVLLSEEPKGGFTADLLEVPEATVTSVVRLVSPGRSATVNGTTVHASWRDGNLHSYLVTLASKPGERTVVIKVKDFAGMERPTTAHQMYTHTLIEGKDKLTLKTNRDFTRIVVIPDKTTTPADTDTITTTETQEIDTGVTTVKAKATADVVGMPEVRTVATVTDTSVMIPMAGRIYISEIMFDRGVHGTLPQWLEISNGSRTEEVNLSGWTLTVENSTADTDVSVGAKAVFTIPEGTRIDRSGQNDTPSTILVVTDTGRNNLDGRKGNGQVVNLWVDQQVAFILMGISNRRYSLLSDMAFRITLAPPATDVFTEQITIMKHKEATDVIGNLGDDGSVAWALPVSEGSARSSIIRRHVSTEPKDGTMMESWVLASDTGLAEPMDTGVSSYYGLAIDIGTPGFRTGGALPVELSSFRPARDKATGAVVITWSTQSELNNAGFFIKRSQQRDGEFTIINAAMVPGAGTTSEKQFYTYTDTTAQPNVVYYYQIEDVSLDGQRQTLTRGIRLKGHVSVAGKATTTWGELKNVQ